MSQNPKESDVLVSGWKEVIYVSSDGTILECKTTYNYSDSVGERLKDICNRTGYHYFDTTEGYLLIRSFVGKNISDMESELLKRAINNKNAKKRREKEKGFWNYTLNRYGDILLGVDTKEIDTFNTGVNIYVLLNSKYAFSDQCRYVKSNKKECVQFIKDVLMEKNKKKTLDFLKFCKITRIVVTRRNEACFTFELKDELQKILQD